MKKISLIILTILVLLGGALRFEGILEGRIHFTFDQGLHMLAVKKIVSEKPLTLIGPQTGLEGFFLGPYYYWLLAIPFILTRGDPRAPVLLFGLWGTLAIVYTYFIVTKLFGKTAGILSAFFVSISPPMLLASRLELNPYPLAFLMILFTWLLYESIFSKKLDKLVFLSLVTALMFQFEVAFAIFLIPVIIISVLAADSKKIIKTRQFLYSAMIFLLVFLPQAIFDLRHDFLLTKAVWRFITGANKSLFETGIPLLVRFSDRITIPWQDFQSGVGMDSKRLALLWLLLSLYGVLLVLKEDVRAGKKLLKMSLIIILTFTFGFLVYPGPVWGWYRAGMPFVYILPISFLLSTIWDKAKPAILWKGIVAAVLIWAVILVVHPRERIRTWGQKQVSALANAQNILDYIYQDGKGEQFGVLAYTPPVYDYTWQYYFWWYGQRKYGFIPPRHKEQIFYLILETDYEKPWRQEGWLKTVIKEGKTVSRKEFAGGIIVEKRRLNEQN